MEADEAVPQRHAEYERRIEEDNEKGICMMDDLMAMDPHLYGDVQQRESANSEEVGRMDEMNDPLIAPLKGFLESLKCMKKNTALEIGCGACHVSRDLLQH